jgi:hypothetical protein
VFKKVAEIFSDDQVKKLEAIGQDFVGRSDDPRAHNPYHKEMLFGPYKRLTDFLWVQLTDFVWSSDKIGDPTKRESRYQFGTWLLDQVISVGSSRGSEIWDDLKGVKFTELLEQVSEDERENYQQKLNVNVLLDRYEKFQGAKGNARS